MTSNKFIELPQTYEQYVIKEEQVQLPTIEEILTRKREDKPLLTRKEQEIIKKGYNQIIIAYPVSSSSNNKDKGKGKARAKNNSLDIQGQHLIDTLNNRWGENYDWWDEETEFDQKGNNFKALNIGSSAGASLGAGGGLMSGQISGSYLKKVENNGDISFLSGSVGDELGAGVGGITAKWSAEANLYKVNARGIQASVGLSTGSGFCAGVGGVEAEVAGFGLSVGKKMGIKTPFANISVDLEETCVIQ